MSDVGWARTTVGTGPPSVVVFQGVERALPDVVRRWVASLDARVERVTTDDGLMALVMRGRPLVVLVDARGAAHGEFAGAVAAIGRTKADAFTGVIPLAAITDSAERTAVLLNAGADEAVATSASEAEWEARLGALMRRSTRDMGVHPTTRLPGTTEIEARLERCIAAGVSFATCYADLDHFKEFNDRYGYNEGDRVIRMVALILHDVVAGATGEGGFVGHIGGDDFIFIVPLDVMPTVCELVVETFDSLVPYQYSDADRRAGYYFGKDRRGMLHRVPLMSLSIGVVTNERRAFTRASQVSALASEMKSYAKAQTGSGYSVDRRNEPPPDPPRDASRRAEERT